MGLTILDPIISPTSLRLKLTSFLLKTDISWPQYHSRRYVLLSGEWEFWGVLSGMGSETISEDREKLGIFKPCGV